METMLSKEVQAGLDAARGAALARSSRLRLDTGTKVVPVLRRWKSGFAVAVEHAPALRGRVDLYDGARHLFNCLIVAGDEEGGEMHYEFKRATAVADSVPLDFERAEDAPVGLISGSLDG